jgi:5-enolpyruvylshikimate-3-phosphate synthase
VQRSQIYTFILSSSQFIPMPTATITLNITEPHHSLTIAAGSDLALHGQIQVPGDKSISHRALMLGAIAEGETEIQGLLLGEDPHSTANCFRAMGAEISDLNTEHVVVRGIGLGNLQEPIDVLNAGNSGTTIRLMSGILASHPGRFFTVTGDDSLRSRPMLRVIEPLRQMGGTDLASAARTGSPCSSRREPSPHSLCFTDRFGSSQILHSAGRIDDRRGNDCHRTRAIAGS